MSIARKNTVVLDFTVLPSRPKSLVVERFITRDLRVKLDTLRSVQLAYSADAAYLEFGDPAEASKLVEQNMRRTIRVGNKSFPIPVYLNDEAVEVRVHDLPPSTAEDKITSAMGQYGEVLTIASERWKNLFPGIPNGVRVLRMRLTHSIPRRLRIDGCLSTITYRGQKSSSRSKQPTRHRSGACSKKMNDSINIEEDKGTKTKSSQPVKDLNRKFEESDIEYDLTHKS
ncbi:conserved hypothetical protein [Culex quinquefasciatus]|uniref:RRM domain-containing protein n=1 Tax=Culex quinquefasciatus TaxID=7176 RepID=B0XBB3_CULQU|nr:conserved hypothetical protein [Culex quinquefasciatus]|eukprot:XP_001866935.1 conserved hypothetical protein [Culex quinquefasciatus]